MYKGNISMPETQIELFLDAGRSLQIEGVAGRNQSINLEDQREISSEPGAREEEEEVENNLIMNSTENFEDVEALREAEPLRSFLDVSRISEHGRTVRQDVTVNIRRLSKEDERLYLSRCSAADSLQLTNSDDDVEMLDPPVQNTSQASNTSSSSGRKGRRSLRRSEVSEVERDDDVIECEAVNTSQPPDKHRRSSRYEDDDEDYVTNTGRHSTRIASTGRRSDRLRKCEQVRESQPERSTLTSTPGPSGSGSYTNLGSLYRTRPMESRRSLMQKTTSDFTRLKKRMFKSTINTKRSEMIRTLGSQSETRITVPGPQVSPCPVTGGDQLSSSAVLQAGSSEQQTSAAVLQTGGSEQQTNAEVLQVEGRDQQASAAILQTGASDQQESASAGLQRESLENQFPLAETESSSKEPGESDLAESDVVTSNIVQMNGRQMCRLCGMQVPDSGPEQHFQRKHSDLL